MVLYGWEAIGDGLAGVFGGLLLRLAADVHVHGRPLADAAQEGVDRETGGLAEDVPEAVVEGSEPAGRLIEPAGAGVQGLVEALAVEGVLADD